MKKVQTNIPDWVRGGCGKVVLLDREQVVQLQTTYETISENK